MKAKLGSPLLLIFLIAGSVYWGVDMARSQSEAPQTPSLPQFDEPSAPGIEPSALMGQSTQMLENVGSLVVDLSQQVFVHDQQVNASGRYLQAGQGGSKTRIELRLSAGDESGTFFQINDGRFIYTRVDTPQTKRLSYVDLQVAQRELGIIVTPYASPDQFAMPAGGLLSLMKSLEQYFDFTTAKKVAWGDQEVWQLGGKWKSSACQSVLGLEAGQGLSDENIESLPLHVPTHVEVVLGLDEQLPLFPYRIVFLRRTSDQGQTAYKTVSRVETSGIRQQVNVPDSEFEYVPDDEQVVDDTRDFIKRYRASHPKISLGS